MHHAMHPVVHYRRGKLHDIFLVLSHRQVPKVPPKHDAERLHSAILSQDRGGVGGHHLARGSRVRVDADRNHPPGRQTMTRIIIQVATSARRAGRIQLHFTQGGNATRQSRKIICIYRSIGVGCEHSTETGGKKRKSNRQGWLAGSQGTDKSAHTHEHSRQQQERHDKQQQI